MRINIINSGLIGRKIIDWTLDPATRPKTFVEFKQQMAGRLDVVDPQITKFQLVDTPADTIVIRLPEKGMIGQAKMKYTNTNPPFPPDQFPFPSYLPIDFQQLAQQGITAEELFYRAVGGYTTAECE
jgi:hypothetical protein